MKHYPHPLSWIESTGALCPRLKHMKSPVWSSLSPPLPNSRTSLFGKAEKEVLLEIFIRGTGFVCFLQRLLCQHLGWILQLMLIPTSTTWRHRQEATCHVCSVQTDFPESGFNNTFMLFGLSLASLHTYMYILLATTGGCLHSSRDTSLQQCKCFHS